MTELLDYISTWSALKWVILVLIAGFIGQFGRMTAEAIMAKVRIRREKRKPRKEKLIHSVASPGEAPRALKIMSETAPEAMVLSKAADSKTDKKALKTAAKHSKKEDKAAGETTKTKK